MILSFTKTAVIIDDGFAPVSLEMIQSDHWAELRESERSNKECWNKISEVYFPSLSSVMNLNRDEQALQTAWELYEKEPDHFSFFDPIFRHILLSKDIKIRPLKEMINYLENDVGLKLLKHHNIANAANDIKRSKLVFLDFYLNNSTPEQIIENISNHNDLFSRPIVEGSTNHRRFLFLISTSLPSQEHLEKFRVNSKLKTAFFKAQPKACLSKDWLEQELSKKVSHYDDIKKLSDYLDTFSNQISKVSDDLKNEIESLELHDLAILNSMRLVKESENLGRYLSWLLSEALAAKIRASAPLLDAEQKICQIHGVPFQGILTPKPVLFDLYSEIAFSIEDLKSRNDNIQFGDVFFYVNNENLLTCPADWQFANQFFQASLKSNVDSLTESNNSVFSKQELLLVISPACDLQRCEINYEVLCVRGQITKQAPNLADLIGQHSFFGIDDKCFKHLLRQNDQQNIVYSLVEWEPKKITTIKVSALQNAKHFQRRAKLSELFGQEIKEEALRQVSRIGVPVDPSFSSALGATIKLKLSKNNPNELEVPDDFISGIFVSANEQNKANISLSEEFIYFLENHINSLQASHPNLLTPKITDGISTFINEWKNGFKLPKSNEISYSGGFKVQFMNKFVRGSFKPDYGIIFYPRGRVADVESESD